jgi:DNA-binding MarR family transcriptional regulator
VAKKGRAQEVAREEPDTVRLGPVLDFLRALWALDHALEQTSKRMQTNLGITAEQRMIIRVVGRYPGIASGRLAQLLHLDAGTISAALRRLEDRRLVVRRRDPTDGRRVFVDLTALGKRLDVAKPATVESAVASALERSRPSELRSFRAVLARLVEALDEGH